MRKHIVIFALSLARPLAQRWPESTGSTGIQPLAGRCSSAGRGFGGGAPFILRKSPRRARNIPPSRPERQGGFRCRFGQRLAMEKNDQGIWRLLPIR